MDLSEWISSRLSQLLDFPVPQDLTEYIVSIENARDLEEYLKNLLNFSDPKHRQFFNELKHKRSSGVQSGASADVQRYKKPVVEEVYYQPKQNDKKKKKQTQSPDASCFQKESPKVSNQEEKKKKKFFNLYSLDGQMREAVMLRGRHECNCQATKHKLVRNCLECGRIICEQEGPGPCFFCGNLLSTSEQQKIFSVSSKEINEVYNGDKISGLTSALEQRNKLLEYDQTSEKRTKVIDDESDYYSSNSVWLSATERQRHAEIEEELLSRKQSSRLKKKVTLDFAGRQVLEEHDSLEREEMTKLLLENDGSDDTIFSIGEGNRNSTLHPRIICERPLFLEQENFKSREMKADQSDIQIFTYRLQDKEHLEMSDQGVCLSMHQPWASLLVAGIKEHEGRVWYHSHRGRLWIAATAKPPVQEEIKEIELTYKVLKNKVEFPRAYPTGCLLGCVNVVDCFPQEEYRMKFPDGESDSPFVFICEDAQELPIKFPIQGKHKIYKLDKKIHEAAWKSLERLARSKSEKIRSRNM